MSEKVILVNENDHEIGFIDKLEAHKKGLLHRAFSIMLFNDEGKMIIQKRAKTKYHSAGKWSNTCCSHPRPNETMEEAINRRLKEEMGISTILQFVYKFSYKVKLENGLFEHEFDHVFAGKFSGKPLLNLAEVEDWKYISLQDLRKDLAANPTNYTEWFKIILADMDKGFLEPAPS